MNNMDEEGIDRNSTETPAQRPRFRPAHFVLIAGLIALIVIFAIKPSPAPTAIGQMPKFNLVRVSGGDLKSEDLKRARVVAKPDVSAPSPCDFESYVASRS